MVGQTGAVFTAAHPGHELLVRGWLARARPPVPSLVALLGSS